MNSYIYGQSEYNILNNAIHLQDYILKNKEYGFDAITLTDPNLYGAYKFLHECEINNIKAILGLEFDIVRDGNYYKMLAYAKDLNGYKSLVKISSESKINNKKYSIEELKEMEGLIFISPFFNSEFFNHIENHDLIIKLYNEYNQLSDFGIGISLQEKSSIPLAHELYEICVENDFKAYPIHQTLYLEKEDNIVYESLKKIAQNNDIKKGNYSLVSKEELDYEFFGYDMLDHYMDELISKVSYYMPHTKTSLPHFPNDRGLTSKEYLRELCEKGLNKRFQKEHHKSYEAYVDRLNYELNVISKMGYDDYFLIVWDYVLFAKKQKVMVGPGRGSACGSLVAYSLGITNVDPLKFDLLFERFLNPERVSMPDIDMDFPDDKRDLVISYVKDKYGKNNVCNISAFGTFQLKSSLRELGKALNIDNSKLNVLIKIAASAKDFDSLCEKFKTNEDILTLLKVGKKIENLPKHISTHAAGIILSEEPLTELVALQPGINNLLQAQWESQDLAYIGLLKMDFLGIRNLSIIDNISKEIEGLNNISIQYLPLNDSKTFKLLSRADTLGVFQLESDGIKKVLSKLQPTNISDIVAVLALYRPGPMDQIDEFIARKNGKPFNYIHKDLEPILKSTYGIIVYQEQIMLIAHDFAGFSLGEADVLRRAVSKKDEATLNKERENFVKHCKANNYDEDSANKIYDYIVKFANYGFNKSHAVGYALLSYQMAYLKANYFNIFMAKILNNVIGSQSEIVKYINYAKARGIKIYKPNINISTQSFIQYKDGLIFPLLGIFGIGNVLTNQIIENRKAKNYQSIDDFKSRVDANSQAIEQLIYSGAFDSFNHTKKYLIDAANNNLSLYSQHLDDVINLKEDEFSDDELKHLEAKALGFNIEYDNFKNITLLHKNYSANYIRKQIKEKNIRTLVEFVKLKEIKTKKNDLMLVGSLTDSQTELDFVMFSKQYELYRIILDDKSLFLVEGNLVKDKYNKVELQINILKKI